MKSVSVSSEDLDINSNRRPLQHSTASWTDDLPICCKSDVGIAPNTVYEGLMPETYVYENRVLNFSTDMNCCLYGVFDGHDGPRAAHFTSERLSAELLLGQLTSGSNDEIVKNNLAQAFTVVERGYFESIDVELAKKTHLQSQLPEPPDLAEKHYPSVMQQIETLNDTIKGGTTALVVVILNEKLFVANVGDSRALLCQYDNQNKLMVQQINEDHNICNLNEVKRLEKLGLDVESLKSNSKLRFTRCIGNYSCKGGYKDNKALKDASTEPIIATPDIYGGISLDKIKDGFIILMSSAVYKSYEEAIGGEFVNEEIADLVAVHLRSSERITGVAQKVADKIALHHLKTFGVKHKSNRNDMTLIVRNINFPVLDKLPSTSYSEISGQHPVSIPYEDNTPMRFESSEEIANHNIKNNKSLSLVMPLQSNLTDTPSSATNSLFTSVCLTSSTNTSPSDNTPTNLTKNNLSIEHLHTSTQSAEDIFFRIDYQTALELDEDNRVASYVNFSCFDKNAWQAAKENTTETNIVNGNVVL